MNELKVPDVACGSGLMGKYIKENSSLAVDTLIGVDIIPEAIMAINRDYPHLYDDTLIVQNQLDLQIIDNVSFNVLSICGGASHIKLTDIKKYIDLMTEGGYYLTC